MRWKGRQGSRNVENRRGRGGVARPAGLGIGGILIVAVLALVFGIDPTQLLDATDSSLPRRDMGRSGMAADPETDAFVSVVLRETEEIWGELFARDGRVYQEPTLVLFEGSVGSACGFQSSAVGPFYCPGDSKVYLDTGFFRDLEQRFGAPGDFARAYVIAHEVAHHIQNLTGISREVARMKQGAGETRANWLSVLQELQADCLAGVWAHHADASRDLLERGDVEEGLAAAAAIGDDRLQMRSRGHVSPESFTHGTSDQRVRWFKRGMSAGDPSACDTFGADGV